MGLAKEANQFHVLAVDDSLIDRKLIECLLKTSSYQGICILIIYTIEILVINCYSFLRPD